MPPTAPGTHTESLNRNIAQRQEAEAQREQEATTHQQSLANNEFGQKDFGKRPSSWNPFGGKARKEHDENTRMQEQINQQRMGRGGDNPVNAPIEPRHIEEQGALQQQENQRATGDLTKQASPFSISWSVLKGGFSTIDLIARENYNDGEPNWDKAISEMKQSFPQMDEKQAGKYIVDVWNDMVGEAMAAEHMGRGEEHRAFIEAKKAKEQSQYPNMAAERGDDPKEIAMRADEYYEERIRELNPNAQNLVGGDQTPQPQQEPNPLDLSMDKLKESQGGE